MLLRAFSALKTIDQATINSTVTVHQLFDSRIIQPADASMRDPILFMLFTLLCIAGSLPYGYDQAQQSLDSRPLPELNSFLSGIKENLKSDRNLLSEYTYTMRSDTQYLDRENRVKKTETREYEVYPSLDEDKAYQKLISKDGKPLNPKQLADQDREYSRNAEARAQRLSRESKNDRDQRLAKGAEEKRKEREVIEDLLKLYQFSILGRESVDDRSAIRLQFTPRTDYEPRTADAKILKKLRGYALISEEDMQIVRVSVELIDDYALGLGLLARVHKGSQLTFVRRKVNNEIWLPAEFHFVGSARAFLLKQFRIEATSVFSDYKKYSVSSSYEFMDKKSQP
jgi:hypothetical protein